MRNVTELSKLKGKVYVYLRNEVVARRFLRDAEEEGFTFGDGGKPSSRLGNDLYLVNRDWTISHVGFVGHMAFQSAGTIGGQELIKVDYEMYVLGEEDYTFRKRRLSSGNSDGELVSDGDWNPAET